VDEWYPIDTMAFPLPVAAPRLVWLRGNRDQQWNERAIVGTIDGLTTKLTGKVHWSIPGVGGLKASHWMNVDLEPPSQSDTPE
jgi:hypothetical protein